MCSSHWLMILCTCSDEQFLWRLKEHCTCRYPNELTICWPFMDSRGLPITGTIWTSVLFTRIKRWSTPSAARLNFFFFWQELRAVFQPWWANLPTVAAGHFPTLASKHSSRNWKLANLLALRKGYRVVYAAKCESSITTSLLHHLEEFCEAGSSGSGVARSLTENRSYPRLSKVRGQLIPGEF